MSLHDQHISFLDQAVSTSRAWSQLKITVNRATIGATDGIPHSLPMVSRKARSRFNLTAPYHGRLNTEHSGGIQVRRGRKKTQLIEMLITFVTSSRTRELDLKFPNDHVDFCYPCSVLGVQSAMARCSMARTGMP